MKELIQKALRSFGYEFRRTNSPIAAFTIQKELIENKNPIIFDIGACHGSVALKYRELFPQAKIYCFEPFHESYEILLHNVKSYSKITCIKKAIADRNGKASFNANLSPATNSLLTSDQRGETYWGKNLYDTKAQVEVETTTIDTFVIEQALSHIDILKIDVQGAEYGVLSGAEKTLSKQMVSLIYTEIIMCPTYKGQHKLSEYFSLLDNFGYEFIDFFNPIRRQNKLIQADVIFLNKNIQGKIEIIH